MRQKRSALASQKRDTWVQSSFVELDDLATGTSGRESKRKSNVLFLIAILVLVSVAIALLPGADKLSIGQHDYLSSFEANDKTQLAIFLDSHDVKERENGRVESIDGLMVLEGNLQPDLTSAMTATDLTVSTPRSVAVSANKVRYCSEYGDGGCQALSKKYFTDDQHMLEKLLGVQQGVQFSDNSINEIEVPLDEMSPPVQTKSLFPLIASLPNGHSSTSPEEESERPVVEENSSDEEGAPSLELAAAVAYNPNKVTFCDPENGCQSLSKKYFTDDQHAIEKFLGVGSEGTTTTLKTGGQLRAGGGGSTGGNSNRQGEEGQGDLLNDKQDEEMPKKTDDDLKSDAMTVANKPTPSLGGGSTSIWAMVAQQKKTTEEQVELVHPKGEKQNKVEKTCTKVYEDPPSVDAAAERIPPNAEKMTVDLLEHEVVQEVFDSATEEAKAVCFPEDSMLVDIFVNKNLLNADIPSGNDGWTAFGLDCRDHQGKAMVQFIIVLGMDGTIGNVLSIKQRAESVVMVDASTILYSSIGEAGAFIWNWRAEGKDGDPSKLGFYADSHTLWYSKDQELFYGMLMPSQEVQNAPSVAAIFDKDGNEVFEYVQPHSHINFVTVSNGYMYLSLRSFACLNKINLETGDLVDSIGGLESTYTILDSNGDAFEATEIDGVSPWHHQHHFEHLDDTLFALFDNHVDDFKDFIDNENSKMVVLAVDPEVKTAQIIFSYDVGEQALIYGSATPLPSGNILGNSYPTVVYPLVKDRSYHANIWEATPDGDLAWRFAIHGSNPWGWEAAHVEDNKEGVSGDLEAALAAAKDTSAPYWRAVAPCEEAPTGWVIYNVERFYDHPVTSAPCYSPEGMESSAEVRFMAFNSVRSQEHIAGTASLLLGEVMLTQDDLTFHKSFLPVDMNIAVPNGVDAELETGLTLRLENGWGEVGEWPLGRLVDLPRCSEALTSGTRLFKPQQQQQK